MQVHDIAIAVFGATGFTGGLVAEHLLRHNGGELRLGLAARSAERLASLRERLHAPAPIAMVQADADDFDAMRALAARSKVVISTVGPYKQRGENLVRACAESGSAYVDLSAEPIWIRRMIERYEGQASRSGARLLFSCGFDSVPSLMAVRSLQRAAIDTFGETLRRVHYRIGGGPPPLSGGTVASLRSNLEEAAASDEAAALLASPYVLVPHRKPTPSAEHAQVMFDEGLHSWTAPFMMAFINVPNVHRSNFLRGTPWEDFHYDERVIAGPGDAGLAAAEAIAAAPSPLDADDAPRPGEGPDRATREAGAWHVIAWGETGGGDRLRLDVIGEGDPGYASTSRMIAEVAMCALNAGTALSGGAWTADVAFGDDLEDRLGKHAAVKFVLSEPNVVTAAGMISDLATP